MGFGVKDNAMDKVLCQRETLIEEKDSNEGFQEVCNGFSDSDGSMLVGDGLCRFGVEASETEMETVG